MEVDGGPKKLTLIKVAQSQQNGQFACNNQRLVEQKRIFASRFRQSMSPCIDCDINHADDQDNHDETRRHCVFLNYDADFVAVCVLRRACRLSDEHDDDDDDDDYGGVVSGRQFDDRDAAAQNGPVDRAKRRLRARDAHHLHCARDSRVLQQVRAQYCYVGVRACLLLSNGVWFIALCALYTLHTLFDALRSIYEIASDWPRAIAFAYLIGAWAFAILCTVLSLLVGERARANDCVC